MKIDPRLFSQILRDDISAGAFRLWHLLYDMTGQNKCCWPSLRTVARFLHCSKNSVQEWMFELEETGYLIVRRGGRHAPNRYTVTGKIVPKTDPRVPKNGTIGGSKIGTQPNSLTKSKNSGQAARANGALLLPARMESKQVMDNLKRMKDHVNSLPPRSVAI